MTRRDAFGNCGLLGMLAALWPWGGEPQPKADPWRDVLDEAFLKLHDTETRGWSGLCWIRRKRASIDHADWSRIGRTFRRADGQEAWLYGIETFVGDDGRRETTYCFVRPARPVTFADVERLYQTEPYETVNV